MTARLSSTTITVKLSKIMAHVLYIKQHERNFMYVRYAFPDFGQLNGDMFLHLAIGFVS